MRPTKVCPVVIRRASSGEEVLVFRHPKAGVQLVKGTIESGEEPRNAALRELREESGIEDAQLGGSLGVWDSGYEGHIWEFVEVHVPRLLPDRWTHFAPDDGGQAFEFYWHRIADTPRSGWHAVFAKALEFIRATRNEQSTSSVLPEA
jgi:8-oxo-dGTP pyrophosphatase MutT (NUDIX family)